MGENYQDHNLLLYPYKSNLDEGETLDGILSGRKDFVKALGEKDPILGWNGIGIFFLVSVHDLKLTTAQISVPSSAQQTRKSPLSVQNSEQIGTGTLPTTQPAR